MIQSPVDILWHWPQIIKVKPIWKSKKRRNMPSKVILIQSEVLGRGDDELGMMLMANFLRRLGESQDKPDALVFWNTGVRLVCEGSWALGHLQKLENQGVEILACGTCLDYFDLKDKLLVGKPTTMVKSIETMFSTDMICL
jgi:selenium metabolism protein YedF